MHKVYVYGTLRPGRGDTVGIPGYLYSLGWFPGVQLKPECDTDSRVIAEIVEVDDARLSELDRYEGHYEDSPEHSFFRRVPYLDGWIYVYNQSFDGYDIIEHGDWLLHRNESEGKNAVLTGEVECT